MSDTVRRFRSLAIAFVVLALSAGVAFAAAPALRPASAPAAGTQAEAPEANENEQGEDPGEQGEDAEQGDDARPRHGGADEAPSEARGARRRGRDARRGHPRRAGLRGGADGDPGRASRTTARSSRASRR